VPPYLAHIRTFGLKLAGSGNVSEHTTSELCRIMSAELTQMACENPLLKRILSLSRVVLLKTLGKCAGLRAKSVHISGHLPSVLAGEIPITLRERCEVLPVCTVLCYH